MKKFNYKMNNCIKYKREAYPSINPVIYSLSSYSGYSNLNNTVYVNGINFDPDAIVIFEGLDCNTFYNEPINLFFYVPINLPKGNYNVVVKSLGIISNSITYNIV